MRAYGKDIRPSRKFDAAGLAKITWKSRSFALTGDFIGGKEERAAGYLTGRTTEPTSSSSRLTKQTPLRFEAHWEHVLSFRLAVYYRPIL